MHTTRHTKQRKHSLCRSICLALLLLAVQSQAQHQPGFHAITWSPGALASGSPVLFRVQLDETATQLQGQWLKHSLTFTRAAGKNAWYALAGVDVEQPVGTYPLALTATDGKGQVLHAQQEIGIAPGKYKTTALHVQEKFVTPDAATLERVASEKVVKDAAYAHSIDEPLWKGDFRSPVSFTPTDSFGTRRMFNGKLASIHRGTDFHAASGTPVYAANDGVVIIAQPMFYEGNLVVVDHGQQFVTQYMHFSKIEVHVGEHVRKGQRLGLSGATGRVTGPHLHFGVRWQGMYVDPVVLLALKLPQQ